LPMNRSMKNVMIWSLIVAMLTGLGIAGTTRVANANAVPILIDFEASSYFDTYGLEPGVDYLWDETEFYQGSRAFKMGYTNRQLAAWGLSQSAVQPNTAYTVEAFVKAAGVNGGSAYLLVNQFKSDGQRTEHNSFLGTPPINTERNWSRYTHDFVTEPDTAFISYALVVTDQGEITVWIDDLALKETVPFVPSQMQNLDFESGSSQPEFWDLYGLASGVDYEWDSSTYYGGSRSLKLMHASDNANPTTVWGTTETSVQPNAGYTAEGFVKTEGVVGGRSYLMINQFNANGVRVKSNSFLPSTFITGAQDWGKLSFNFVTEADTAYIRYALVADSGAITVWFDDLALKETVPNVEEPLPNLGFEQGLTAPAAWDPVHNDGNEGQFVWDSVEAYEGQRSAKLVKQNSAGYLTVWGNDRLPASPNTAYTAEAYLKIANAQGGSAFLLISQFNANGERVQSGSFMESAIRSANQDWSRLTHHFITQPDTAYVSFALVVNKGTITVWFDDLDLYERVLVPEDYELRNGGFEEGDAFPSYWDIVKVENHEGDFIWESSDVVEGQYAAQLEKTNASGYLGAFNAKKIQVAANQDYRITGNSKIISASGGKTYVMVGLYYADGSQPEVPFLFSEIWQDEKDWTPFSFNFTIGQNISEISVSLIASEGAIVALYDELKFETSDETDLNGDFERGENDKPFNWNLTVGAGATGSLHWVESDYYQGEHSIRIERSGNKGEVAVVSGTTIPVEPGHAYRFMVYVKSSSAWLSTAQLSVMENTTSGAVRTHAGIAKLLNQETLPSGWTALTMRYIAQPDATKVRLKLGVSPGNAIVWYDRVSFQPLDRVVFEEDVESLPDSGALPGWEKIVLAGSPSIEMVEGFESSRALEVAANSGDAGAWRIALDQLNPAKKYVIHGMYQTTDSAIAQLSFNYINWAQALMPELNSSHALHATNGNWMPFTIEVTAPSAYRAFLSLELASGMGTVKFDDLQITEQIMPLTPGAWNGEWIWYPEDAYTEGQYSSRYFRQVVSLSELPKEAYLQITADDKYSLYVNGEPAGEGWDWRRPQLVDITDYLHAGQNVIAIVVNNDASAAGLLYDGYVIDGNGTFIQVKSDQQVKTSREGTTGWLNPGFDDSQWATPMTYGRPPALNMPWGDVPTLITSSPRHIVTLSDYVIPEILQGGDSNQLSATYLLEEEIPEDIPITVHLMSGSTRIWSHVLPASSCGIAAPTSEWPVQTEIAQCYDLQLPSYIPAGVYNLQFVPEKMYFMNEDIPGTNIIAQVEVQQQTSAPQKTSSIQMHNGTPTLFINGQPQSTMMFSPPVQRGAFNGNSVARYGEEGVNQVAMWVTLEEVWERDNTLNFTNMDAKVVDVLSNNPGANIMVKVLLDPPLWWEEENPDDQVTFESGKKTRYSFASLSWREQAGDVFEQIIAHINEAAYNDAIFGYQLMAGRTAEWMWWDVNPMPIPDAVMDFSPAALSQFRLWLEERYGNVEALQAAWGDDQITFETAEIPQLEDRLAAVNTIVLDPHTNRAAIDFHLFMADMVNDSVLHFANIAKEATNHRLVVGAYYGYVWNFYSSDANGSAHIGLSEMLESPAIDFYASPISYDERSYGQATTAMSMIESVKQHGKMFVVELDNRTWKSNAVNPEYDYLVGKTDTVRDAVEQLKRDFSYNLIRGNGLWMFDMDGGWFDDEQLYTLVGQMKDEMDYALTEPLQSTSDVAVYVNEKFYSYLSKDFGMAYSLLYPLLNKQRHNLATMGAPFDTYLISDLVNGNVPDYKVNIMISPFELTAAERTAIDEELKRDDKFIVWLYLPGLSDGQTLDVTHMESLTGFDLTLENRAADLDVAISDTAHPLSSDVSGLIYGTLDSSGSGGKTGPIVYITDPDATSLGILKDNQMTGLAYKQMDGWQSVYSSAPNLPNGFLSNLISYTGGHTYTEEGSDVLFANRNYVMLYSLYGGEKTISLPSAGKVYDVFGKQLISNATSQIVAAFEPGETKLFRIGAADDTEPGNPHNPQQGSGGEAAKSTVKTVTTGDLKAEKPGVAQITLEPQHREAVFSGNVISQVIDTQLTLILKQGDLQLAIPVAWWNGLLAQNRDGLQSSSVSIRIAPVEQDASGSWIDRAQSGQHARIQLQGMAWDVRIVWSNNGREKDITQFASPLTLSLPIGADAKRNLSGIYYLGEDGKPEYVGGRIAGDRIEANLHHLSTYAVLTYAKQFDDVSSEHWAADAIQALAARQVVQGTSASKFDPNRSITRAEFTALLARAIGIGGEESSPFQDVKPDAWYAGIVAGAVKAGLVTGVSATAFHPDAYISREQMAVMLIRAYKLKTGGKVEDLTGAKKFTDEGNMASWSKEAVQAAVRLKLMIGRTSKTFVPKGAVTRAESAKAIHNMLQSAQLLN